jgi:hypothetical protein
VAGGGWRVAGGGLLGGVLVEEFAGDSFGDGEDSGGPAAAEEGFQLLELGELLADGVGAFGVVGVVEGRFSRRGPAVGAGVVGFRQVIPNGSGWMGGLREELVHGHLLLDGGIFLDEDLDLIEECAHGGVGKADEEARVDIRQAGDWSLLE